MEQPKKYRKKPVEILAMPYTGDEENIAALVAWGVEFVVTPGRLAIKTLEGWGHDLTPGDLVIRGVKGEFYPCKPDIFEATYDGPSTE